MNLQQYTDKTRYPATTQDGLTPKDQLLLDSLRWDGAQEFLESGKPMNLQQQEVFKELQEKMKFNAQLAQQLAQEGKK